MKIQYTILQLKDMRETAYGFMRWDFAKTRNFSFDDYSIIYSGSIDSQSIPEALEDLFEKFNTNRPADFKGHSLSVSDIIVIKNDVSTKVFYCDSFGWKDITSLI